MARKAGHIQIRMGTMIHIFAMKATGQDYTLPRWNPYLSDRRRIEAEQRKNQKERRLYLAAEILLNRSLEKVGAGLTLPAVYERNAHGKPYLTPSDGYFVNWSHSGEYVVCAVSDREVGIDLQRMDREPAKSLIKKTLQPEERCCYESLPESERTRLFYQYWAAKESYLKTLGTGFYTPLQTFYVRMDGGQPRVIQRKSGENYECRLLDFVDDRYVAAVCCAGEIEETDILYF